MGKEEVAFTFFIYDLVVKCQATISEHLSLTFLIYFFILVESKKKELPALFSSG